MSRFAERRYCASINWPLHQRTFDIGIGSLFAWISAAWSSNLALSDNLIVLCLQIYNYIVFVSFIVEAVWNWFKKCAAAWYQCPTIQANTNQSAIDHVENQDKPGQEFLIWKRSALWRMTCFKLVSIHIVNSTQVKHLLRKQWMTKNSITMWEPQVQMSAHCIQHINSIKTFVQDPFVWDWWYFYDSVWYCMLHLGVPQLYQHCVTSAKTQVANNYQNDDEL